MYQRISKLFKESGLGEITGEIKPVTGGLMHKVYEVPCISGMYAVKCLNPEIMKRTGVFDNFINAEELENILEENGIPIVPAIRFGTKKLLENDGRYYYIFKWQPGSITDPDNITSEQSRRAGEILGSIHRIDFHNVEPADPEMLNIEFETYIQKAEESNREITGLLKENLLMLKDAQRKLNEAVSRLPAVSAIDDPDMDSKNIMWDEGKAHVIDLECLRRGNPIASCLDLALQWSGTISGKYIKENLEAFFNGYLSAYDNGFRSYDELFGIAYTWLEWLEYNIKRALGMEGTDAEEMKLGEEEVRNTVERIRFLYDIEKDVCKTLENLPAPDPGNFKTHDDSLVYIDLVFEGPLSDIPEYGLPDGYRFVDYKTGDKTAWIDIELSAEEVLSRAHGEDCWKRYYETRESELPGRMFFIENKSGEKIATATAFYDIHGNAKPGEGQLHWVAIKKDYQGKGLSKPLITYVLNVMKSMNYDRVKIHTQTNTWLACKVYYDLGFRPEKESLKKNRFGWKMTEKLTGIKILY